MLKYVPRIGILMDDDKFTQLRELLLKLFVHANNPSTIFYYCSQLLEVGKHFGARMKQVFSFFIFVQTILSISYVY
jgi:hypothetical protein